MSKASTRFALEFAMHRAVEAMAVAARYSPRAEIAGSIRRGRPDVGDVDLVLLESEADPWMRSRLALELAEAAYIPVTSGEWIATFRQRDGQPGLDLYYCTPATWAITLLVRTGSAAHNIRLAQAGAHMLPARRLSVARGIIDTADQVIPTATEDDVFRALGLPFVAARDREAPELEHLVRPNGGEV